MSVRALALLGWLSAGCASAGESIVASVPVPAAEPTAPPAAPQPWPWRPDKPRRLRADLARASTLLDAGRLTDAWRLARRVLDRVQPTALPDIALAASHLIATAETRANAPAPVSRAEAPRTPRVLPPADSQLHPNFRDASFVTVLRWVAIRAGIDMRLDPAARADLEARDQRVTLAMDRVAPADAFEFLLDLADLRGEPRGSKLYVSPRPSADARIRPKPFGTNKKDTHER